MKEERVQHSGYFAYYARIPSLAIVSDPTWLLTFHWEINSKFWLQAAIHLPFADSIHPLLAPDSDSNIRKQLVGYYYYCFLWYLSICSDLQFTDQDDRFLHVADSSSLSKAWSGPLLLIPSLSPSPTSQVLSCSLCSYFFPASLYLVTSGSMKQSCKLSASCRWTRQ